MPIKTGLNLSTRSPTVSRFTLTHIVAPLVAGLAVLAAVALFDVDRRLLLYFYEPVRQVFPLRDNWILEQLIHRGGKYAVLVFWLTLVVGYVFSPRKRRILLFLILSIGLSTAAISLLKQVTNRHCPYELREYGGDVVQTTWLARSDHARGRCFPGGHASAGFALMALYFVWYGSNRRLALVALSVSAMIGLVFGSARMMQGAHFLSHNLWSALLCWLIAAGLYRATFAEHTNFPPEHLKRA